MKTNRILISLVLLGALLLSGCSSRARVGALRTESQSVELGDAKSVRVEVNLGAGNLEVAGGAEKLMEADFNYNVARLKPEVEYTDGTLVVRQPDELLPAEPDRPGDPHQPAVVQAEQRAPGGQVGGDVGGQHPAAVHGPGLRGYL